MDLLVKTQGPLNLVHFTKPWDQTFAEHDLFFDSFSNCLIQFKEGQFVIWDIYDQHNKQGLQPFTLHLATVYKKIYALCLHPSKSCIALQIAENVLNLLFLAEFAAEEIKLTFSKAKMIHAFSFAFGDDYNFFIATDISIDLYKIKLDKQKAQLIKNIYLEIQEPQFYFEPMASVVVVTDNKGQCHPFFLNMYQARQHKGKTFTLEVEQQASAELGLSTQGSARDSVGGRDSARESNRMSISDKAKSFFNKKPLVNYYLAQNIYNKNIKLQAWKTKVTMAQTSPYIQPMPPKRNQHQILLSVVYNKVLMSHYNPAYGTIQVYELDPGFIYKNMHPIEVTPNSLIQMQVIDNLIVVHNLDQRTSKLYDMKLQDYHIPLAEDCEVKVERANKGMFITDMIREEELSSKEEIASKKQNDDQIKQDEEDQEKDDGFAFNAASNAESKEEEKKDDVQSQIKEELKDEEPTKNRQSVEISNKDKTFFIYDETLNFVDPMIIVDLVNFSCLTLKLSLPKFVKTFGNNDQSRMIMSLINRPRNKPILIKNFKNLLITEKLSLLDISGIFMRINTIYKQASIERQSINKREYKDGISGQLIENALLSGVPMEKMLIQQQRLSRLRNNTALGNTVLNNFLMEYSLNNRVLSGEVIIFQSEIIEIFKEIINHTDYPLDSTVHTDQPKHKILKSRNVVSIIMEFLRSLMENQIPQQPTLQNLLIKFILDSKDFLMLHTLLQYHVLGESLELARILVNMGSNETKLQNTSIYYQPAFQLGLDMLKKLKGYDEIVVALLNEGQVLKSLNFAQEYNVHSMKLSSFLEVVERMKQDGKNAQAEVILKRITEIKKYDEVKAQTEKDYRPILVEE